MSGGERYVLRWESPACDVLKTVGRTRPRLAAAMVSVVELLATDPHYQCGGREWVETKPFVALRKAGFPTWILKAQVIQGWRIFYFVLDDVRAVLIKEIVTREEDEVTYGLGEHVQRIKRNLLKVMGKAP